MIINERNFALLVIWKVTGEKTSHHMCIKRAAKGAGTSARTRLRTVIGGIVIFL